MLGSEKSPDGNPSSRGRAVPPGSSARRPKSARTRGRLSGERRSVACSSKSPRSECNRGESHLRTAHGDTEQGATIAATVLPAIRELDDDRAKLYHDLVYNSLNDVAR